MNKTKWKQPAYHRSMWQVTLFPMDDWKWEKEKWDVKMKYKWMSKLVGKEKKKETRRSYFKLDIRQAKEVTAVG